MHIHHRAPLRRASGGFTLVEALIAMLVLAFGMLAIAGFQANLSRGSDVAKQRSEATRIAQRQMDRLRAFGQRQADGTPADGSAAGDALRTYVEDVVTPGADYQVTSLLTNATFNVNTTVTVPAGDRYRWVRVLVTWNDRAGAQQRVDLNSAVADGDPGDVGLIGVGRGRSTTLRPKNRNINIPYPAVGLLGGQTSAFIPPPGNVIFVFDNTTGNVTLRCTGTVSLTEGIDLVNTAGVTCVGFDAYLLSGYIRFKTAGAAPNASNIDDQSDLTDPTQPLLATDLTVSPSIQPLTIDAGGTGITRLPSSYECYSQRQLTVRNNSALSDLTIAEGAAIPAGYSASGAPRFIAYTCIVRPIDHDGLANTPMLWSGEVRLNPLGWVIGSAAAERRVCRYSSDYNRNGLPSNHEHPRFYRDVTGAIDNQNFLVIKGNDACPTDVESNPVAGDYVDTNTATHQPTADAVLSFRCLNAACNGANKVDLEPAGATVFIRME